MDKTFKIESHLFEREYDYISMALANKRPSAKKT